MAAWLNSLLQHPLTKGLAVDNPETTRRRREIIRSKPFLRRLYQEWYSLLAAALPPGAGQAVELGSGAGFIKEIIPEVITTEVLAIDGVDMVLPADGRLPFPDRSLRALLMTDVLHHINESRRFFAEASRAVHPGGVIVMIEPWVTPWSSLIYRRLHAEPFRPEAATWEFPSQGPLSGANSALPWIIFERDRRRFAEEFPQWTTSRVELLMPFSYLLSGGVSLRAAAPGWLYPLCRFAERRLFFFNPQAAMFAFCVLTRNED
ncbi:MAG: class I SAM-dependent methyltransferase [Candidatus Electronema sp. V4]|uniref:class I SAM-dependent methyltransferase n=1 Tax=Candidatus Electronema sp. V4 TaxID=3454756 RepID=UPI004055901B